MVYLKLVETIVGKKQGQLYTEQVKLPFMPSTGNSTEMADYFHLNLI